MMREIVKMRYLWNNAMEFVDSRLESNFEPDFGTPFGEAVVAKVRTQVQVQGR